jgi:hypothetical protein
MHGLPVIRLVKTVLLSLIMVGCDHASPFEQPPLGAVGPRVPGPEARLDSTDRTAVWTEDGKGFLYTRTCFGRRPVFGGAAIASIVLRPAHGGSATWELCEATNSFLTPRDSAAEFSTPALGDDGRLLYVECVWPNINGLTCGNAGHMTMWLGDSARPFSRRRKLFELHHAAPGRPPDPPNVVNQLTGVTWIDTDAFTAIGANFDAFGGFRYLGVVYGTTGASPSLYLLPGTGGVQISSAAESNHVIVFTRDSQTIQLMPIHGGASSVVATMPLLIGRRIVAISCRDEFCLVVTNEPAAGDLSSTFWSLSLDSRVLTSVRTVTGVVSAARISPSSNAVLVARGDVLYLYDDLLP